MEREQELQSRAQSRVTIDEVQKVHILIERCLSRAMGRAEIIATLARLGVHPRFTALVYDRLEAENPAFFAAYHVKAEDDITSGLGSMALAA